VGVRASGGDAESRIEGLWRLHLDNKVRVGPDWFGSFEELLDAV